MTQMLGVRVPAVGRVETESRERPAPGPGQVSVRLIYAGICGSDTHAVAGRHPLLRPPYHPGHEAVGTVAGFGAGATGRLELGQRVILKPNLPCGACVNCRAGRTNACQTLRWIGCDPSDEWPGAMAERFVAPEANLFAVPDRMEDQVAALVECLATPIHAVRLAGDLTGAGVAVTGAGTIGLFTVIAARLAGASRVVATDFDPDKRARAARHGAVPVDAATADVAGQVTDALGGPADVVFDCVAAEATARQGVAMLRGSGQLMVVGVPAEDFALPMPLVQDRELTVQGCANYTAEDFEQAIHVAAAAGFDPTEFVSAVYPLERAAEAFAAAARTASGKVLVRP
jgi:threonine dehydrogenase-like Zn-dependent dehydrogenase